MVEKGEFERRRGNFEKRVVFPASVERDPIVKEEKLDELTKSSLSLENLPKEYIEKRVILSPEEEKVIEGYLSVAKEKLIALGVEDAEELLPSLDQIIFTNHKPVGFQAFAFSRDGVILLMQYGDVHNPKIQENFFHEIAHFINKVFLGHENGDIEQLGFDRVRSRDKEFVGVYAEPLCELFALYCINDKDKIYETAEKDSIILLMVLLEKFAKNKSISNFEAFRRMFVAQVKRDFTFQGELVDVFGTQVVRDLNNYHFESLMSVNSTPSGYTVSSYEPNIEKIIKDAGVVDRYHALAKEDKVAFEGLPGFIK